ncbi:MAG: CGNR zinc finger domain-containing protein [Angustibacter sp.]
MAFDSHLLTLLDVAAGLVNLHSGRSEQGRERSPVDAAGARAATAALLRRDDGRLPRVTVADAATLADHARQWRRVFDAVQDGDDAAAAVVLNRLLRDTGARPQLDPLPGGGWHVHFHGRDDSLVVGWAAGCTTALALALGSDLAGRMRTCAAERCDAVFVDTSKNGSRRFCSTTCQNRTKTAAYRSRSAG